MFCVNLSGRWLAGPVTVPGLVDLECSPTPHPQPQLSVEPEDSLRCVTCLLGSHSSKGCGHSAEQVHPGFSLIVACLLNSLPALAPHSLSSPLLTPPLSCHPPPHQVQRTGFLSPLQRSLPQAEPCFLPSLHLHWSRDVAREKCAPSPPPSSSGTQVCQLCNRRALLLVPR